MTSKINYDCIELDHYLKYLRMVGALSALFSESKVPLLHYRAVENIYCKSFGATNLARDDVSVDAKSDEFGIGIKTFIEGHRRSYQKIAEFNKQQKFYHLLPPQEKIMKISSLRNKRLDFTMNAYDLRKIIYHCVVRSENGFSLYEEDMDLIDSDHLVRVL